MKTILIEIGFIILAYLIGASPNALIIGKLLFKIDIREHGSKNMGATNTLRVMGMPYAVMVFIFDAIKGGLMVFLFNFNILSKDLIPHIPVVMLGLASIIGHIFPVYVGFKGGKGVASTTGVLLSYHPILFIVFIVIFLMVVIFTKFVSAGSITSIIVVFFLSFFLPPIFHTTTDLWFSLFCGIMTLIIIIDHLPNIKRLIKGTESKTTKALLNKDLMKEQKENEKKQK